MLSTQIEDQESSGPVSRLEDDMATTDYPPLTAYLDRLANLIPLDRMRDTLSELEEARDELDRQIEHLRSVIVEFGNGGRFPPKREAVLRLMRERPNEPIALAEIRAELIRRSDLADTKKAGHALQMAMLALAKEGILTRPRTGFYLLPQLDAGREPESVCGFNPSAFTPGAVVIPNRALAGAEVATPTDLQGKEGEA